MTDHITVERADRAATIWIDRPEKRNAMTHEMWVAVADAAHELATDRSVRVVVVRGRGGHFCAGADVSTLQGDGDYATINRRAEDGLAAIPKPTIAFLTGSCVGGGAQMALACDLRISDTTLRAGITPARLGIVYPAHSVERATRAMGPSATKHLLFSAELVDADRALRTGFVDEVHEPDDAVLRLDELVDLLANRRSALTQRASKAMVDDATTGAIDPELVERWDAEAADSKDMDEGVAAFLERREPDFGWNG